MYTHEGVSVATCNPMLCPHWFVGNFKKPMILCACSTSRSHEQRTKCRSRSKNMWKVWLFYSQNNKILLLSNMTDICLRNLFTRCTKVCGLFSLDCAFWMLIGWAGELRSHVVMICISLWIQSSNFKTHSACLGESKHEQKNIRTFAEAFY